MFNESPQDITDLSKDRLIRLVGTFLGEVLVHYGMWFTETLHHRGAEVALELESQVLAKYVPLAMARLAPHFGIDVQGDVPKVLADKSREELLLMIGDIAKTWVVGDGLWFQAVEASSDMAAAKEVNDTCWSHFAPIEALKICRLLGLGRHGGLKALERALKLRIYSSINAHATTWDTDGGLVFEMTECRVQSARRRKGMTDYPCKSGGLVEYTRFANAVDSRIRTECVWCPPDRIPDQHFCTWKFTIEDVATGS